MQSKRLTSIDPMKLAWLLRADLRRGMPASVAIPEWFETWWNIEGLREYPAWSDLAPAGSNHWLRPLEGWPSYGVFGVSRALQYIFERREDLRQVFDLQTQAGQWKAIAWMYTHGITEYRLHRFVDSELLDALDESPPFLQIGEETQRITWLMYFVWLGNERLQETFDLRLHVEQGQFLQWFLVEGVPGLQLFEVVSARLREWAAEPIQVTGVSRAIPRTALLLWNHRADLRAAFSIATGDGAIKFQQWLETNCTIPQVSWWYKAQSARPATVPSPSRPHGINLIGFAYGELGIGEDVRMAAAACLAAKIPFTVLNISPGTHLRQTDTSIAKHVSHAAESAPYAINVFCLTAFDTARVALEQGPELFENRVNVGWWPWELPVWPQDWQGVFGLVQEVWAATTFTRVMYADAVAKLQQPPRVRLVPMAASVSQAGNNSRRDLGISRQHFLFLYVFDANSYIARKNPFAVIKAFQLAFPKDPAVRLVLKSMNKGANQGIWNKFIKACAEDKRIHLIQQTMDRSEILSLIRECDAYISLHRAEGLGRTLAEALLFGNPVIATDFSGNADFLTRQNGYPVRWKRRRVNDGEYPFITESDGAWWAEPDILHAAEQMKAALNDTITANWSKQRIRVEAQHKFCPKSCGENLKKLALEIN